MDINTPIIPDEYYDRTKRMHLDAETLARTIHDLSSNYVRQINSGIVSEEDEDLSYLYSDSRFEDNSTCYMALYSILAPTRHFNKVVMHSHNRWVQLIIDSVLNN